MIDDKKPIASILITVYNRQDYVADAIESSLAQSLENIEIIILDDYSADNSWQIANYYANHPKVHLYRNEVNLGQFRSRNKIASLARGRYLKYLDSDDVLLPHSLEVMVGILEHFPSAGMLLWSSDDDDVYPRLMEPLKLYRMRFCKGRRLERAPLSTLIRKNAFDWSGGFSLNYPLCADSELIYRMARKYPAVLGPQGLVFYRIHDGQVAATTTDSLHSHKREEFHILLDALRSEDCPLPKNERLWHLCRILYGSLRYAIKLATRQSRLSAAWNLFCTLRIKPHELFGFINSKFLALDNEELPAVELTAFPIPKDVNTLPQTKVSLLIYAESYSPTIESCLLGIRHQWHRNFEVLIAVPAGECTIQDAISLLNFPFIIFIEIPKKTSRWSALNSLVGAAKGTYIKFIDEILPFNYPYQIFLEALLLDANHDIDFLAAGALASRIGGFRLNPETAISLEIATDGEIMNLPTSGMLFRRKSLLENTLNPEMGDLAPYDLCARLACRNGLLLGPYGLYSAWKKAEKFKKSEHKIRNYIIRNYYKEDKNLSNDKWIKSKSLNGSKILSELPEICHWNNSNWMPRAIHDALRRNQ